MNITLIKKVMILKFEKKMSNMGIQKSKKYFFKTFRHMSLSVYSLN